MIRYKVVRLNINDEGTRLSCAMSRQDCFDTNGYMLEYSAGRKVEGLRGTMGIFVFKRRLDAYNFISRSHRHLFCFQKALIIRVKTHGRGHCPPRVSSSVHDRDITGFYKGDCVRTVKPPIGTICYPAVTPLE